jgi:hypothetical protein
MNNLIKFLELTIDKINAFDVKIKRIVMRYGKCL